MAVFDTRKAFEALNAAGFTERQAKSLLAVGSEGYGAPATKTDLRELGLRMGGLGAAGVVIISMSELIPR